MLLNLYWCRTTWSNLFYSWKSFYQRVTPDLFNIQWSKICFKSGTINNSFSRNCSIRKWQLIREQLLGRFCLIQFCISHEINLAENTMKLYSGSLILTYVLWCSRYDKKWALASTTGTAPCTTTPIIKNWLVEQGQLIVLHVRQAI